MGDKDHRKKFDNKRWGNWRYNADNNTFIWDKAKEWPYDIGDFDSADAALRWLAHVNGDHKEQDVKDLAEAFSEILQCPGLASAYDVRYDTLRESKKKVMKASAPNCDNCACGCACYTDTDL